LIQGIRPTKELTTGKQKAMQLHVFR